MTSEFDLTVGFSPWRTNPNFIGAWLVAVDAPAGQLGDYHLTGASPAIDAGAASKAVPTYQQAPATLAAPTWDIDNDGRPNGAGYDVGADEIAGMAAIVTTATSTTTAAPTTPPAPSGRRRGR